jgi:hypothetical protein
MPPINIIEHALERMNSRGISETEVIKTVRSGKKEPAKNGRIKFSMEFNVTDREKRNIIVKNLL